MLNRFINYISFNFFRLGEISILTFQILRAVFKRPFSFRNFIDQIINIGFNSLPVVLGTAFSVGMVMALQFGSVMENQFEGASNFLGGVLAVSFFTELGPVLTSLMVTGRVGSAIAAEIGTMKVTEQLDALIALSADPIQYLAVPRLLASVLVFPLLVMIANIIGILGGGLIAVINFEQNSQVFLHHLMISSSFIDVISGLIKASFFGFIMAIISSYYGFNTINGAQGVGQSTKHAVVISSITIIISDYFLNTIIIELLRN